MSSKRILIKNLICDGLGYCCTFCFFKLHKRTGLISERLGVSTRAIRYHKMAFKDGEMKCEGSPRCMKGKLI